MKDLPFDVPKTLEDIERLISNGVPESIHLEYKSARSLSSDNNAEKNKKEISKDVSSFANSAGGVIIYGIKEDNRTHEPKGIEGTPLSSNKSEWLENVISSNISPVIQNIEILPVTTSPTEVIFCVCIPQSYRAPHQANDKKYYKRYNFKSEPMEDYEINGIRARSQRIDSLVNIALEPDEGAMYLVVSNVGDRVAENICIDITEEFRKFWTEHGLNSIPPSIATGFRALSPKQTLRYIVAENRKFLSDLSGQELCVTVNYTHPAIGMPHTDSFYFRPDDFQGMVLYKDPIKELSSKIDKSSKEAHQHLKHISEQSTLIFRALNQVSLLEQARLQYQNVCEREFRDYHSLCLRVVASTHNNFSQNLKFFLAYLLEDRGAKAVIELLPEVEFDSWFEGSKKTGGSIVGSADIVWPNGRLERLALQKKLIDAIAENAISAADISLRFMYISTRFDDCVSEVIRVVFIPFSADFLLLLSKQSSTSQHLT